MDEAKQITEVLGPRIQKFLDDGVKLEALMVGLSNLFALTLNEAGLSKLKTERLTKRLHKKIAKHGYNKGHAALVTESLGGIIASSGVSYVAAAWSISGALLRCAKAIPDIAPQTVDKFAADLVELINEAAPQVPA